MGWLKGFLAQLKSERFESFIKFRVKKILWHEREQNNMILQDISFYHNMFLDAKWNSLEDESGEWIFHLLGPNLFVNVKVVSIAVFLCYPIYPIDMMIHMLRMSSIKLEEVKRRRSSHVPPPPAQVLLTISWIPLGIHIICTYYTWVSTVGCRLYSLLTPNIWRTY